MTEQIEVKPISTGSANEYETKAVALTKDVAVLKIETQLSYEAAADRLKQVKDLIKVVEEARKSITSPLDKAKKAVMDLFNPVTTRLENSERHIKGLMTTYFNEQEAIRKKAEEKAQQEAKEREDKEKARLAKLAEKQEARGDAEKAEETRQKAQEVYVAPQAAAPTVQQAQGVSMRKAWKAEVVDIKIVPREYLIINQTMINGIATASKDSLKIPGIRFYSVDVVASRC